METGVIPPNIHFKKIRRGVKALENGKLRVVSDPTPWKPGLVGINSFGFGGSNVHVLLRPNPKIKVNKGMPNDHLPRLVVMSGRTEQAVESFLNEIESQPIDIEYIRLFHDIFATDILKHPYRGYTIIESEASLKPIKEIQQYSGVKQPVCFVFSGIGSQWLGMGQALLQFPVFSQTVERCNKILSPHGVHVNDILTNEQETNCNNILNSLVGITVMQIGLIDLLKSVNITPDYVIGHSIGELCCGYITNTFTIEQVMLSTYYIGLALNDSKLICGAMMNIALGYEKVKSICPSDIEISSFGPNNCCMSGPKASVKSFAAKLQANNILINELDCNDIPLHSHYLVPARAAILAHLNRIIPQTMTNSHVWTSSVCDTKLSYAEYFTNNLLSPTFFEKVIQLIPKNAITIEIAPHGILQNVMKDFSDTNVSLIQHHRKDNVKIFLQGLGKIYNTGSQLQLANLYPTVQFPVSRGTPMISPSIRWNHSTKLYTMHCHTLEKRIYSAERIVTVVLIDLEMEYLSGHVIDGRILVPATRYLILVWETLCMLAQKLYAITSVVFEDVKFLRATHLQKQGSIELIITLQKATGNFEVTQGSNAVVSGRIRFPTNIANEKLSCSFLQKDNEEVEMMTTKDIYKELKLRGYQYNGLFRRLKSASTTGRQGHIIWNSNWVTFMDCILQLKILGTDTRQLYIPTGIQKLVIDTELHGRYVRNRKSEDEGFLAKTYRDYDTIICGGIEMSGLKASPIAYRKTTAIPVIEQHTFVPHRDGAEISFKDNVILSTHLALEHHQIMKPNIIELIEDCDNITEEELESPLFDEILSNLPLIQPTINLIARTDRFNGITFPPSITISRTKTFSREDNAILVTGFNLLTKDKSETLKEALLSLQDNGFLLVRGKPVTNSDLTNITKTYSLVVVLEKRIKENHHITLLKKKRQLTRKTKVVRVNNHEFSWLEELKGGLNADIESSTAARIILVGEKDPECGLLGFVNCLRKEPGGELIRGVFIQDETAPDFSLQEPLYAQQLELDLIINVLHPGKVWGSYRHLPVDPLALKPVYHAFVNQLVPGDLSSLNWLQGALAPMDYQHQDLVHIIYAPINFKDVMIATGKVTVDSLASRGRLEIGFEYVGIDNAGRRIMGICENRCISNMQQIDRKLCWSIPEEWTLQDAATVPIAYCTCCYALYIHAKMKKGDKVLIHSGTGAVGQAAIHLSLHKDCEVFTTVGTPEKRKFIRDTFPSIPESHIGNSRDSSFEQMILQQTKGRGVDIVLNPLAEEKLQASIRCLARGGCFLEIGKYDLQSDNLLDLSILSKGIKFFSIMLDNVFLAPEKIRDYVYTVMDENLKAEAVKPLVRKVFQKDEVEAIIIKVQEEDDFVNAPILALPHYYCLANKTYVILGGLGGFGLELADWLVIRGARNLVLISRFGIKNGYQHRKIELWKSYGVNVSIMSNIDASNINECEHILKTAEMLAPIDAIFNLAVVLNDKLCQNHTAETFQESFKAKAWATKNLDQLSRKICLQLRYFVVFSSVSCGRGNAGQTNYGMANSIMERICERRSREGLHGLAIQWGAVGDVGIVADMMDDDKEMIIGGTLQQKISSCIEKLEEFLLQEHPIVASMVVAEKCSSSFGATDIAGCVANIMSIKDLTSISHQTPLPELGMDSIMAVEIKQTLERDFDTFLTVQDIRTLNFAKLKKMSDTEAENADDGTTSDQDVNLAGIKLFVRLVGGEQFDVLVDLPTKQNNTKYDIFLLPGIESSGSIFDPLGQKIEASATCIQYGIYNIGTSFTSISGITDCVLQHIVNSKKLREKFVIVGYSYGSLIAIELAHRLEKLKMQCRLVLIDGAPEYLKVLAQQQLQFSTIDEFQNNILLNIMDMLQPINSGKLLLDLNKCSNWDEKLDTFISHAPPSELGKQLSINMKKAACTMCNHLLALREYDVMKMPKIASPIILLKPTVSSVKFAEEDYGLSKITTGNIEVYYVNGNHVTIVDSDDVLASINGKRIEN
ncbi:Fatty acid synthase [Ooceraea biroi]|uniref:Fatty acid synthase n=1 Tax=Ooceraea biroi TaxID=2015173 RepID=A0A026WFH9_OOCBI|nr:Fatty acid synthase [Ooceraea biroi]